MAKKSQVMSSILAKRKNIALDWADTSNGDTKSNSGLNNSKEFQETYYNTLVELKKITNESHARYYLDKLVIALLDKRNTETKSMIYDYVYRIINHKEIAFTDNSKKLSMEDFNLLLNHLTDHDDKSNNYDLSSLDKIERELYLSELIKFLGEIYKIKDSFTIYTLASCFENVMSKTDVEFQKVSGAIYTPQDIAEFICYEALVNWLSVKSNVNLGVLKSLVTMGVHHAPDSLDLSISIDEVVNMKNNLLTCKVLEPSVGAGVIYITMLKVMVDMLIRLELMCRFLSGEFNDTTILDKDILKWKLTILENMYGLDINKDSIQLAKDCIKIDLLSYGLELPECLNLNLNVVDSTLTDIEDCESSIYKALGDCKFDIVIGNPPYVRSENISDLDKALVKSYSVHHGNADLLCYFYEQGFKLLRDNGVLAFITSNKWMTSNYGKNLRQYILDNCELIGLLDFKGNRVFKGVGVDTEITFLRKCKNLEDRSNTFWYCDGTDYTY